MCREDQREQLNRINCRNRVEKREGERKERERERGRKRDEDGGAKCGVWSEREGG